MQDHERVERGDAAVTIDIRGIAPPTRAPPDVRSTKQTDPRSERSRPPTLWTRDQISLCIPEGTRTHRHPPTHASISSASTPALSRRPTARRRVRKRTRNQTTPAAITFATTTLRTETRTRPANPNACCPRKAGTTDLVPRVELISDFMHCCMTLSGSKVLKQVLRRSSVKLKYRR